MRAQASDNVRENAFTKGGSITRVHGTVKWFDHRKGFGFVVPDDGGPDIFLGKDVIEQANFDAPTEGARVYVACGRKPKGMQAIVLYFVEQPLPAPNSIKGPAPGLVKMFNDECGYGFISVGDGLDDIFFHINLLHQIGLETISAGDTVDVMWEDCKKGLTATQLSVLKAVA